MAKTRSTSRSRSTASASQNDSSQSLSAVSTRASSFSSSSMAPLAPAPTPETDTDGHIPADLNSGLAYGLRLQEELFRQEALMARHINLVHMDDVAHYVHSSEAQTGLDSLLSIVKRRDGGPHAPDYRSALNELDYLEGLFRKLRFSYKEQLTKETVVRRILELELPLLSPADMDAIVADTEAERRRLRELKAAAHEQGVAAENLVRELASTRQHVETAEAGVGALPDRLLQLRQRLVRMKLALRAELASMDDDVIDDAAVEENFRCGRCGRRFHTEAFYDLHQAMHDAPEATTASMVFPLRRCRGCAQKVPALFVDSGPPEESHRAFHVRLQQEVERARQALLGPGGSVGGSVAEGGGGGLLELGPEETASREETEEIVVRLQVDNASMAMLESETRENAQQQAAVESEMAQSIRGLRESVGSIRIEMMRLEQVSDRMVHCVDGQLAGQSLGRTLQEQAELYNMLLDDADDEME